ESLDTDQQAAGMAVFVPAYRIGMLVSTALVIAFVSWLELNNYASENVWFYAYAAMALLVGVGMLASLLATEPEASSLAERTEASTPPTDALTKLWGAAYGAFVDFMTKPHVVAVLLFVLLFKFCDAFAGVMTGPFVIRLGFDKAAYAGIVKGVGFFAVL